MKTFHSNQTFTALFTMHFISVRSSLFLFMTNEDKRINYTLITNNLKTWRPVALILGGGLYYLTQLDRGAVWAVKLRERSLFKQYIYNREEMHQVGLIPHGGTPSGRLNKDDWTKMIAEDTTPHFWELYSCEGGSILATAYWPSKILIHSEGLIYLICKHFTYTN